MELCIGKKMRYNFTSGDHGLRAEPYAPHRMMGMTVLQWSELSREQPSPR